MSADGIRIPEHAREGVSHLNVRTDSITVTEDKAKIAIREYAEMLKEAQRGWQTPLALSISLLATLVVAEFKDMGTIKAAAWQGAFVVFFVLALVWLGFGVVGVCKHRGSDPAEELLSKLRGGEPVARPGTQTVPKRPA